MEDQIFGIYKVLEKDEERSKATKHLYWKCECLKCHAIRSVRADNLKRYPSSCPDCKNSLLGQTFGQLKVIAPGKIDSNGHRFWICQCECGNQKEINGSNLRSKVTTSCGCNHKKRTSQTHLEDLTGQTFGFLKVIRRANTIGEKTKWLCQCEKCGNYTEVAAGNLKNGHTISCGCINSKGELKIRQLLNVLKINYKTEYTFNDLPQRRYDFYLPDLNTCIEYDGLQHFSYVNTWHCNQESFEKAIQRDKEKTDYCQQKNIKLIRIPYYDYDKLTLTYLSNLLGIQEEKNNE